MNKHIHYLCMIVGVFTGCSSIQPGTKDTIIDYEGEKQPIEKVSIIYDSPPFHVLSKHGKNLENDKDWTGRSWLSIPAQGSIAILPSKTNIPIIVQGSGAHFFNYLKFVAVPIQVEAGRKYLITGAIKITNQTESISTFDFDRCDVTSNFFTGFGGFMHEGKILTADPAVIEITTEKQIEHVLSSTNDWRIKLSCVGLCNNSEFFMQRLAVETNREVRFAIDQKLDDLNVQKLDTKTAYTYIGNHNKDEATLKLASGFMDKIVIWTIDGIYDPRYPEASEFKFLPGDHTLRIYIRRGGEDWYGFPVVAHFDGNRNYVMSHSITLRGKLHIVIEDTVSKKTVLNAYIHHKTGVEYE